MSWNQPPSNVPPTMQRPPLQPGTFNNPSATSNNTAMNNVPPKGHGPPLGNLAPPFSVNSGPPSMTGLAPPPMRNGPPLMGNGPPPMGGVNPPAGGARPTMGGGPPMRHSAPNAMERSAPLHRGPAPPPSGISPGPNLSQLQDIRPIHNGPPGTMASNQLPPRPGNPDSPQINRPPSNISSTSGSVAGANELLPVPYHGKGIYTHNTHVGPPLQGHTPTNSEPPSLNTSRVPSPIPTQQFDALEGQFRTGTPSSNRGTPPSGSPVPHATPSPRAMTTRPNFPQTNLYNGSVASGQQPPMNSALTTMSNQPIAQPFNRPPLPPGAMPPPTSSVVGGPPPSMGGPPSFMAGPPSSMAGPPPTMNTQPPMPGQPSNRPPQPGQINTQPVMSYAGGAPGQYQPPATGQPRPGTGYQYGPPGGVPVPSSQPNAYGLNNQFGAMGLNQQPSQVPVESRVFNLLQERNILPPTVVTPPVPNLPEHLKRNNCNPDVFRCTLNSVPQSNSLLQKCRLPMGILIHPFKDLSHLPVIQSSVIVRCRSCRTYINPFVSFIDQRRWRCNLCYRANELPEEFNFDPVSKSYGSPERRPEIRSSTIEFVAPSEYMLRPPQPCVYLFLLDVSYSALQSGALQSFCEVLAEEIDKLPGDGRTLVGFISYNSNLHFYNLSEDLSTPQTLVVSDVDDIFLPLPDGLLANLKTARPLVEQLLQQLPTYHQDEFMRDDSCALGAALQAAIKLASPTGGRITVVQSSLPNIGPGKLVNREDPNQRASSKPANLQPSTDFYKVLSLEAAGQQIAIDMFLVNSQYADYATIGGAARHSGGCIYAYPGLHTTHNPVEVERFEQDLRRYLTRKIGLEAVMRVRCTKGLSVHTFHGNFFVRSTDLLSLPNINPDAGFGMQVSIEENLTDSPYACFQAALLYTSSKGERRIRVHTLCLPVSTSVPDIINSADQQAIINLLSKMAVDRCKNSAVADAREALVNACADALGAFSTSSNSSSVGSLAAPYSLRLLPLYVSALLKHPSIRVGVSTKVDERIQAMDNCKYLPLSRLMHQLVPDLYPVHALTDEGAIEKEESIIPQPPRLSLNSASIDRQGAFLMDVDEYLYLWIGSAISPEFCSQVFDRPDFHSIQDGLSELPELENETSERLRSFVGYLQDTRPSSPPLVVIREDSRNRFLFTQHMVEDKSEAAMSYYEFLQHIQKLLKS